MNTVLYCQHYAQTLAFYEHVLGLQRTFSKDWFVEFRVAQEAFLSVADQNRATISSAQGKGLTLTFQVDDVRASHDQLHARGATLTAVGPRPWGAQGFLLHDPEGTRIEIWAPSLTTATC
ncbi:MAG: catechol 2,3-dioxygenase-like lactoylglutathione lyase family enzyme [Gammaproteobacteria bacterium]|jgi:catechol 2,3-dioxygenase-like lactoylglutathione lyase family enzyme